MIGLGRLGFRHAETVAGRVPNARLIAVSDPLQATLDRFIDQFPSVKAYPDYRELISAKEIDAVLIASPTNTHTRVIIDAIKADKYIFCEKPLTLDMKEADELNKEIEKKRPFIQVGFMRRFDRGYAAAKAKLLAGEVGQPVFIHCISRDPAAPPLEFAKASGGLFLDLCIHDIDLARWLMGSEITQVYAQGGLLICGELEKIGDIDHTNILVTFANGALGNIEASRNARYGYDVRTEIICTKGALFIGELNHTPCVVLDRVGAQRDVMPWFIERFEQAYLDEIRSFVQNILEGREPSATVRDGFLAVKIAAAAKRSYETGQAVRLGANG